MRETAGKMAQAKTELAAAKLVRKNRQEYDLMAKMIEEFPSRDETLGSVACAIRKSCMIAACRKLAKIKEELNEHQNRQRELELKVRTVDLSRWNGDWSRFAVVRPAESPARVRDRPQQLRAIPLRFVVALPPGISHRLVIADEEKCDVAEKEMSEGSCDRGDMQM
jgi:hypothetical protein